MQKAMHVFVSYAREDERLRSQLEAHLTLLQRQGLITTWYDHKIDAGTERASEIDSHLNSAQIILLLVSASFLASEYCYSVEMTQALARHEAGQAQVIPVILRPVDLQGAPFAHLQTLPHNARPVTSWVDQDEAFLDITKGIRTIIGKVRNRKYDAFLFHSTINTSAVEHIARRLVEARLNPFFRPWHLTPGVSWQEVIEEMLEQCEVVVVFLGSSDIHPWYDEQLQASLDRAVRRQDDMRIIPALLPGSDPKDAPSFLMQRAYVDFRSGLDDANAFNHLVAGILGRPPRQQTMLTSGPSQNQSEQQNDTFTLPDEPAPYPSLLPFTSQQAKIFFGRDKGCSALIERVNNALFTAVVGASGSGKSSLVHAGLLPRLKSDWRTLTFVPGSQPVRMLAEQLATLFSPEARLKLADDLEQRFFSRPDGLSTSTSLFLIDRADIATLVLVIDQFEEVFTQVQGSSSEKRRIQQAFIENITRMVQNSAGKVRCVITLRADFIRHCLDFADLRELLESKQLLLGPMSEAELREAIVKPAQVMGAMFEKGLVGRIIEDMRDHSTALPLLQVALAQLWQQRQGVWLTHVAYEEAGGIRGAINQRAEAVYSQLTLFQQQLARKLFLRLVTLNEDTSDTRRRMRHDELMFGAATQAEVEQLITILSHHDARLITTDRETIELTHEALIAQWDRLHTWLEENRVALRVHRQLTEAAHEWYRHNQEASYLYGGLRLMQALEWAKTFSEEMNAWEATFLEKSQAYERARREAEEEAQIEHERLLAELPLSRAGEALFELGHKPERALLLAIAAVRANVKRQAPMVLRSLYRVFESAFIRRILRGHTDRLSAVAWSPDGRFLLTGSYDSTARIWDRTTGQAIRTLIGHAEAVTCVAWSPDGDKILTGSWDKTAFMWEVETGRVMKTLRGHEGWVSSVSWSADARFVATGGMDHTARLWSAQTGETLQTLVGHTEWVRSVEWHSNGKWVLTGSYDGTARLWDTETGLSMHTFSGHTNAVAAVAWSPNGEQALTASEDGTVRLWDRESGEMLRILYVHTSPVYAVAWSPDGLQALTGSEDGNVRIWDVTTGTVERMLPGHTGWVSSVSWSPDGQQVASGCEDATARICDVVAGTKVATLKHTQKVISVDWHPGGKRIATACGEDAACIWDMAAKEKIRMLHTHSNQIVSVAWSPDGDRILTGCKEGRAYIWDAHTGTVIMTLIGHKEEISSLAWNPDGRQVVTGSRDGTARLWNIESGINIYTLWHKDFTPLGVGVAVDWSPDGQRILVGTSDKVKQAYIWDVSKKEDALILSGHRTIVQAVAWSPDGQRVITTCGDGTARIWDASNGSEICVLYPGESQSVAWNPNGEQVLTASHSGIARIWDVVSGAEVHTFVHKGPIRSVAWSSDGSQIATGSWDTTVCAWDLHRSTIQAEMIHRICSLYIDEDIQREIPDWRGRAIEIAQLEVAADRSV